MTVLMAAFLGLVQGITEFLPISSSGHLSILQNIFGLDYSADEHLLFEALLHLGTLLAVCLVYREDLVKMAKGAARLRRGEMDFSIFGDPLIPYTRQLLCLAIGTVPLLIALIFYNLASELFSVTWFIGLALVANGFVLYASDLLIHPGQKKAHTITPFDGLCIGLAQMCAVIPGLSRSAATLTTAMSRGCSRSYAMRFSLLLSIPAILGSVLVSLGRCFTTGVNWSLLPAYLVGFAVSAVTSLFGIRLLQRIMRRGRFGKLSVYCWVVGIFVIILSIIL